MFSLASKIKLLRPLNWSRRYSSTKDKDIDLSKKSECLKESCNQGQPRLDNIKNIEKSISPGKKAWVDCVQPKMKKVFSCADMEPEVEGTRRARKPSSPAKCQGKQVVQAAGINLMGSCDRYKIKGCKEGKIPPKCERVREAQECEKKPAPTLSFSECVKKMNNLKLFPQTFSECNCFNEKHICEIWEEEKRMGTILASKEG